MKIKCFEENAVIPDSTLLHFDMIVAEAVWEKQKAAKTASAEPKSKWERGVKKLAKKCLKAIRK